MLRVASLDAAMLFAETPEMPMHTMGVLVLARPAARFFERFRHRLAQRIHLVPPLRRRAIEGPLGLGDPHWIEDPDFSLERHLFRIALPAPGDARALAACAGAVAGRLLARTRPLWEMHVVEGLRGGDVALIVKVHHAAMDGGRLVALMNILLDTTPRGRSIRPPAEPWRADPEPSLAWFAGEAATALAAKPLNTLRALGEMGSAVFGSHDAVDHTGAGPRGNGGAKLFEAPPTPFNGALSAARAVAMSDVAFADVKAISRHFGTTVNDVVLAASCAGLRDWLRAHHALPDGALVANVPVAVRGSGAAEADTGNRVSMILAHLPVGMRGSVPRLLSISAETRRAKERHGHGHGKGDVFRHATDLLTSLTVPWVLTHLIGLYSASDLADRLPPPWNLVISNLPGPRAPLYCAGVRLRRVYPFGPVQLGSGLNLTVMSCAGRLCLGALACREMMPDPDRIARGFVAEIDRLKRLARR